MILKLKKAGDSMKLVKQAVAENRKRIMILENGFRGLMEEIGEITDALEGIAKELGNDPNAPEDASKDDGPADITKPQIVAPELGESEIVESKKESA